MEDPYSKQQRNKQQGVFYTPPALARSVARQGLVTWMRLTLDRFLDSEESESEAFLKYYRRLWRVTILDPACGNGSLLAAARELLDKEIGFMGWKLRELGVSDIPELPPVSNLYGVELDPEAVFKARALTHADIRLGHALIDDPSVEQLAFDWRKNFPEIIRPGGFDVILVNPPYVFTRNSNIPRKESAWYRKHYSFAERSLNLYALFMEKCHSLLNDDGCAALLTPNTWLTIPSCAPLRAFILGNSSRLRITNITNHAFEGVSVDACLTAYRKGYDSTLTFFDGFDTDPYECDKSQITEQGGVISPLPQGCSGASGFLRQINANSLPLSGFADLSSGLKVYEKGKGTPPQTPDMISRRAFHSPKPQGQDWFPYLDGEDVGRYRLGWTRRLYLHFGPWLASMRKKVDFSAPRILVRQIPADPPCRICAAYTEKHSLSDINSHIIFNFKANPLALLAVLNSRLVSSWFACTFHKHQRKIFPQFKLGELALFPIPKNLANYEDDLAGHAAALMRDPSATEHDEAIEAIVAAAFKLPEGTEYPQP